MLDFISNVLSQYPHIKIIGLGSGSLVLAKSIGALIDEEKLVKDKLKFMGRE